MIAHTRDGVAAESNERYHIQQESCTMCMEVYDRYAHPNQVHTNQIPPLYASFPSTSSSANGDYFFLQHITLVPANHNSNAHRKRVVTIRKVSVSGNEKSAIFDSNPLRPVRTYSGLKFTNAKNGTFDQYPWSQACSFLRQSMEAIICVLQLATNCWRNRKLYDSHNTGHFASHYN